MDDYTGKDPTYIQYLDANNLYGWAVSQPLPTGGFKWVEVSPQMIPELSKREDKGYILEVDVKYSPELYDSHNDLPFMSERMKINGGPVGPASGVKKLVPKLYDKRNYVIHIKALKQAINHGLIL